MNATTDDRATYGPRHGDRWEVRDGKAVVVASNDWPPPTWDMHESELGPRWPLYVRGDTWIDYTVKNRDGNIRGGWYEWRLCRDWVEEQRP